MSVTRTRRTRAARLASLGATLFIVGVMFELVKYKLAMLVILAVVALGVGMLETGAYALKRWRWHSRDRGAHSLTG